jgi:RND family efflux transporter MFP subunit
MTEPAEDLRRKLTALRLERGPATPVRRRRPIVIGAVIVALLGLIVAARTLFRTPPAVEVAQVTVPPASSAGVPVLSGAGYVVSAERYVSIGVRVAGRIDRYLVEEGDRVQAGDPLVQLDAREYEAGVRRAEANVRQARATAVLKRQQRARAERLAASGVLSRDELDVRIAEADTAEAAIAQTEAALAEARVALDYTTLRAPTAGIILAKSKEVGEIAVPGGFSGSGDLIRMANLEDLRGQVDVTESELAKIRSGQAAEVVPDAYPDRHYEARVVKLYPQIDRQKGTLRVEAQIAKPDEFLWPDMSARVTFLAPLAGGEGAGRVLVPRAAVRGDEHAPFVWTVVDGRVHRVPVTVGGEFGDQLQATSGLAGGETVIVGTPPELRDGQAVAIAGR